MNGLNIGAHDGEGRQLLPQFRQGAAQLLYVPMRAQDPADHEVAIGGGGDEKMLELAASCIDVVGADAQSAHGPGESGQGVLDRGHVEGAAAQVDAAVGTENAEDGGGRPPGDHHLRLVAEAFGCACHRRQPGVGGDGIGCGGEHLRDALLFATELEVERHVLVRAGAAGAAAVQSAEGGRRRRAAGGGAHEDHEDIVGPRRRWNGAGYDWV